VINAVNSAQPGDKMEVTVLRGDNEEKTFTVTLADRPAKAE
jgi:S1-C subfamily serine protease